MFYGARAFDQNLCSWQVESENFCIGASCGDCNPPYIPGTRPVGAVPPSIVMRSTEAPTKSPRRRSPRSF
jgi:hypothetical protein